jgi:hypothetical protein
MKTLQWQQASGLIVQFTILLKLLCAWPSSALSSLVSPCVGQRQLWSTDIEILLVGFSPYQIIWLFISQARVADRSI